MTNVNINCGVLGHVDSGKTSLCRGLHEVASTASMDKHPQSKERGITLDIGFSSFRIPGDKVGLTCLEVTLVDCPGHASLIRTVLGASQIIDLCILVVDAQRVFQTQTAECLVIAEIVTSRLLIVVNKIDLIPADSREQYLLKLETGIRKTMSKTRFGGAVTIVPVSATCGLYLERVVSAISEMVREPPARDSSGSLHIAFDHCFTVKGQGTVLTGTVLAGCVKRGQKVYLPESAEVGEVRSLQKFRRPSESASQGDRVGLCIPGITPDGQERGNICGSPNDIMRCTSMVFLVKKIKYFKGAMNQRKFHISIGHHHAMATPYFFRSTSTSVAGANETLNDQCRPSSLGTGPLLTDLDAELATGRSRLEDTAAEFELISEWGVDTDSRAEQMFCWLQFDTPIKCQPRPLMIASRLDLDADFPGCRLAFYGRALAVNEQRLLKQILKTKTKIGQIDRKHNDGTFIVRGFVKKSKSDVSKYIGLNVTHSKSGIQGTVDSSFGKSGLLRVTFASEAQCDPGDELVLKMTKPALSKVIAPNQT